MILTLRSMWRDWGFPSQVLQQAKTFSALANSARGDDLRLAYIRASILFSLVALEGHFHQVVRGYIEANRNGIDPANLQRAEEEAAKRLGIDRALRNWPGLLTGNDLDTNAEPYTTYSCFRAYRNVLVHGNITAPIQSSSTLAQDLETSENAELANTTARRMINMISRHFGFECPTWARE